MKQVKMPATLSFDRMAAAIKNPDIVLSDFAKIERGRTLHFGFMALDEVRRSAGQLPSRSAADVANFITQASKVHDMVCL